MNLVSFSIRTKGLHNFIRRLTTVFTRFGFSEQQMRRALHTVMDSLRRYDAVPTFFIPAVVLHRHSTLIAEVVCCGAEVGVHGYVHNDYRSLSEFEQYAQTERATTVFQSSQIPYGGFRNPYLGWTEDALRIFAALGFTYESNEAILHDVVDLERLPLQLRGGYEKSLLLYRTLSCNAYNLRPHFDDTLLRIPISVPDDEMLLDRLRITNAAEIGRIWSAVMQRVYELGGLYTLNLHPERAVLCKDALDSLLSYARSLPFPIWLTSLGDVNQWWRDKREFALNITRLSDGYWLVDANCTSRATLLARHLTVEDQPTTPWMGADIQVHASRFTAKAAQWPCIGLSSQTPRQVADFLQEQGYPTVNTCEEEAERYAFYLDMPCGLGTTREEQILCCGALVQQVEQLDAPLLHFGSWPSGNRAALAVSGDIDSVTIQDFFLRILEAHKYA
jgi:peptidoglycan/xylan/chitin deacetylase (PgdA/CDA1 family)